MTSHYLAFHQQLLQTLADTVKKTPPFDAPEDQASADEDAQDLLDNLLQLANSSLTNDDDFTLGQQLLCRIIAAYPHITPFIARDLLWFFGGDCLHYMPDDEIEFYQTLDEKRFAAEAGDEPFNYEQERANLMGLN